MTRFLIVLFLLDIPVASMAADNAIWQKALDKQTLRCGYITYEPGFVKDVNTSAFSGYDKDIIEAVAKKLEMKIEWIPASGWGTFLDDIKTGKFDMLCNATWANSKHAKYVLYSRPAFFQPLFFIARKNDRRFDGDVATINNPKTTVGVLESDIPYYIMKQDYPKANLYTLPPSFDFSLVFNEVVTKKADLTVSAASDFYYYSKNNPGKLQMILQDKPVRVFPSTFVIPTGETQMQQTVNQALDEMILSGELKTILQKYNHYPHSFYFPTIDYQTQ